MAYSKAVKNKISKLEIENYKIKHELGKRITYLEDLLKETTAKYEQKADALNKYKISYNKLVDAGMETQSKLDNERTARIKLEDNNRQMTGKYELTADQANRNQFKMDKLQQEVNKLRDNNCKLKNHIINQIINS